MARTTKQIFDDIITAYQSDSVLGSLLTSASKTAFYRLVANVYATITNQFEVFFDLFESRVEVNIQNQKVGQLTWYQSSSLDFQYGDVLEVGDDYQLYYTVIDADKRIVTRASATSAPGFVYLKVAKDGNNNTLQPLTATELTAFNNYWKDYDFQPSFLQITSTQGDIIDIQISVTLNPQVFDLSTGLKISDGSDIIGDTINTYLNTFSDDNFGGDFYISQMNSELLSITGVEGVVFNVATASDFSGSPTTDILAQPSQSYNPVSGYFETITKTITVL